MNYAEITDLASGWRELTPDEVSRGETLITWASVYLDTIVEQYGIDVNEKANALRIVCCELVRRKMESASELQLASLTQTAGAFSETKSYTSSKIQSWRLYPEELEMLGIKQRRIRIFDAAID